MLNHLSFSKLTNWFNGLFDISEDGWNDVQKQRPDLFRDSFGSTAVTFVQPQQPKTVHPKAKYQETARELNKKLGYLSHFLSLDSVVDLLPIFTVGQHGTVKEITESWGMYKAALNHLDFDTNNPDQLVVVIGDGATARTGAVFAYMTKATVISVDPNFRADPTNHIKVSRLTTIRKRVEDIGLIKADVPMTIIMPHAHAHVEDVLDVFASNKRDLIVMPCCHPKQQVPQWLVPDVDYQDEQILSQKNRVLIYKDV